MLIETVTIAHRSNGFLKKRIIKKNGWHNSEEVVTLESRLATERASNIWQPLISTDPFLAKLFNEDKGSWLVG